MGRTIPFSDLKKQLAAIRPEMDAAIKGVLDRCDFIQGEEVKAFEAGFARYAQAKHCIGVANGTDAIVIALRAMGLKQGERVITVSNTFIATTEAISLAGGIPVFVDALADTLLMDPSALDRTAGELRKNGTPARIVIPVHLYGQAANMTLIGEVAKRHQLQILEDCAQAHGARWNDVPVGSFGSFATWSFYPGKNLGAYGDGGAITANDDTLAKRARMFANHGRTKKYEHEMEGVNSRLDTIQAAVLNVKLRHLERWTEHRRAVARTYQELLAPLRAVKPVGCDPKAHHVYHLFVVRCPDRERVMERMKERGVHTGVHYPIPLHLQPAYRSMGLGRGSFPVSEAACEEILSLPIDSELTPDDLRYVVDALSECLR
jgi:dTDP-4-amino-4,6-dideoxygalactose transaminase